MWGQNETQNTNECIKELYSAVMAYQQLQCLLGQSNVGFTNTSKFFGGISDILYKTTMEFMNYQIFRGGRCNLNHIALSEEVTSMQNVWGNGIGGHEDKRLLLKSMRVGLSIINGLVTTLNSVHQQTQDAHFQGILIPTITEYLNTVNAIQLHVSQLEQYNVDDIAGQSLYDRSM